MGPVIKRITKRVRHRACPRQKFVVRRCVARAVTFVDTISAHRTPLVMIAFEPDFEKIVETPIASDVFRRKMRVIVEDRLGRGIVVVQAFGGRGLEQEIIVNKVQTWAPISYTYSAMKGE